MSNKNLANCTTKEFLKQANLIRHKAADFYKIVGIADFRKNKPTLTGDETQEEKQKKIAEQGRKNLSDILDKCIDENLDLTLEIIGLMCFKTKEQAEEMEVSELFDVVFDVLNSERVISFFTKLANSGLISMGNT